MKLTNKLVAMAFAGAVAAPMSASAITIDGITFSEGSVFERINLAEGKKGGGPITALGDELVGIGKVTSIEDGLANETWSDGDNGRELTIYFEKFIAETISITTSIDSNGNSTTDAIIGFSGGVIKIFSDAVEDFSFAGAQAAGIASATGGSLFLELAGSPIGGVGPSGNPITLLSSSRCAGVGCNPLLTSISGGLTGLGNLDVVGGSAAAYFDTNVFGCDASAGAPCPDDADKTFSSSGQLNPLAPANGWAFRGTGEVQDFAVIPEPGTLALLGAGLVGIAARRRKAA